MVHPASIDLNPFIIHLDLNELGAEEIDLGHKGTMGLLKPL